MRYTPEQIAVIAEKLRAMPPVEKPKKVDLNKQEAVKTLSKEIAALQKRGYTLIQISESLRGSGLDISTPTLKSYLQRTKPAKSASRKTEPARSQPTPETSLNSSSGISKSSFQPKPDTKDI